MSIKLMLIADRQSIEQYLQSWSLHMFHIKGSSGCACLSFNVVYRGVGLLCRRLEQRTHEWVCPVGCESAAVRGACGSFCKQT